MSIAYLEISSFIGTSFDATHYYGKLVNSDGESVELYKTLSIQEARQRTTSDYEYQEGWRTSAFDTRDEIIQCALKVYKNHIPDARCLILGYRYIGEPQFIIDMQDKNKNKELNLLFKQAEEIDFWENDEALMQKIEDEWGYILNG
ncbi:hypothetical protein LCGC14_1266330 [marine sediment metagenome]|uniref:Uncharacterized protein n=1 Tax=marine sediment metagenome TaxID=412755 RepID=A0A0F9NG11_9ZZZZ